MELIKRVFLSFRKRWKPAGILLLLLCTVVGILCAVLGTSGWREDERGIYYISAKTHGRAKGLFSVEGSTYFFDEDGYLQSGFFTLNGQTYYADDSGKVAYGIRAVDGKRYCFDPDEGYMIKGFYTLPESPAEETYYFGEDGVSHTGWLEVDQHWYYFGQGGVMYRDLWTIDGKIYYFDDDGMRVSGWAERAGQKRYYLTEDGTALLGHQILDGKSYYFDPKSGQMHTGLLQTSEGDEVLYGDDGVLGNGFTQYDGFTFYTDARGVRQEGFQVIDGNTYFFNALYRMELGWTVFADGLRYFKDGVMLLGWQTLEDGVYYFDEKGCRVSGEYEIDGQIYCFDQAGRFYSGWHTEGENRWYYDELGYPVSGYRTINGYFYGFDEQGKMLTDVWRTVDGARYYFGNDGTAAKGLKKFEDRKCYFDEDFKVYTGFIKLEGFTYYFDGEAGALVGTHVIDGQTYTFAANGILASELEK